MNLSVKEQLDEIDRMAGLMLMAAQPALHGITDCRLTAIHECTENIRKYYQRTRDNYGPQGNESSQQLQLSDL
jgi:hypothetical protein